MLTTLVVCLANCIAAPDTVEDQLGMLAGSYVQLCHEMHHLKRGYCPAIMDLPVIMQCYSDVYRELPGRYRAQFKKGINDMQPFFETGLASEVATKFNRLISSQWDNPELACQEMSTENKRQRFQKLQQLKILSKKPR